MVITTQLTKDYYIKAKPLFESVKKYWDKRFVLGCIDFDPTNYDGEYFVVPINKIKSYRKDWPKNRNFYVSMQAGEFAEYIDCEDDEVIICIDADTIMQAELNENFIIDKLKNYDLLSTYGAWPPTDLNSVLNNLKSKSQIANASNYLEFTASILIAKKKFFKELAVKYNETLNDYIPLCEHHALTQWVINWVCTEYSVFYLPPIFQCGSWYEGFGASGKPLKINGQTIIFNHNKFND